MVYDKDLIKHTLLTFGFNLDNLNIDKINHVPMHEYRLATKDKPLLYVDNLQCCISIFAYGNGFGFASHINPVVIRNDEYIEDNGTLICKRCSDLLNSLLSFKGKVYEPFKVGIALGTNPIYRWEKQFISLMDGYEDVIYKLIKMYFPIDDLYIINKPEFIIDTENSTIISPEVNNYLRYREYDETTNKNK